MFQAEVPDANTASVVSTSLGIPISVLTAGLKSVAGRQVMVNQSQLDRQQPAMRALAESIVSPLLLALLDTLSLLRKPCSAEFLPEATGRARVSGRGAAFAG